MSHRDISAIAVATLALLLAAAAWVADAFAPGAGRPSQAALDRASAQALETQPADQPLAWRDPATGTIAVIAAASAYRDGDGSWCRPFTITLEQHGAVPLRDGIACRGVKGGWTPRPSAIPPTGEQIATADGSRFDVWLDRLTERTDGRTDGDGAR